MNELTSMQAACWMGRNAPAALGNVAAHLYAEFDGQSLSLERLHKGLEQVYALHPMLRVKIDVEGLQSITVMPGNAPLEIDDLQHLNEDDRQARLLVRREQWTHQKLDLENGQAARWCLSLLPKERFRLHVDTDMIAVDPSSFLRLIEDLAMFCEAPGSVAPVTPSFLEWHDKVRNDASLNADRTRDRLWWREQLAGMAPAPLLPYLQTPAATVKSHRLHAWLMPRERQALHALARERRLTLTQLMLGLFAATLGKCTSSTAFRLNVPTFWRAPLVEGVERIVGEFANVLILDVQAGLDHSLAHLCEQLSSQLTERLGHCAYSGVNVMRDLSRLHGSPQLAPVVFTSALDLPGRELFSPRVARTLGPMNWVVSQGPQVALDAQVACMDGGILINWDVRLDALPLPWVQAFFEEFVTVVRRVSANTALLDQPISSMSGSMSGAISGAIGGSIRARPTAPGQGAEDINGRQDEKPLNALQQAYLLGRSEQMPLGGVAMQEFREYRVRLDPQILHARLSDMVRRHESLRTHIDVDRLVQWVNACALINLDRIDLSQMSQAAALAVVDSRREAYAHALFTLDHAPWNVTCFNLPEGDQAVFVRFDALILDGRSIAALMVELFEGGGEEHACESAQSQVDTAHSFSSEQRKVDAAYWQAKLANVTGAPSLPWQVALEQSGTARYARHSLRVPKAGYDTLCKLGARQRLFKNSTIMAVVLEVLSHWLDEGDLCVAVPVAVPVSGAFANRSSFLAINWQPGERTFADRASSLQTDVLDGLQHLAFSGVDLARLLFEAHGPGPVLPVVITNGLSWPVSSNDSPAQLITGLTQTPQVAMDIRFSSNAQGDLVLDIDYAHAVVSPSLVNDLLTALGHAIEQIVETGVLALHAAQFIDHSHYRLNSDDDQACQDRFLTRIASQLFERGNTRTALISGDHRISYAELGEAVNNVIAGLAAGGVVQGQVVAICLPRSFAHTAVTLACALTGVIWVPIDAQAPAERRQYLLDNCRPDLVVMHGVEQQAHQVITPEQLLATTAPRQALPDLDALSLSESAAYYLYTSGTTGRPKCVVLNNRATANVIGSTLRNWQVTNRDVFISVTPLHHDMSLFDVLGCLTVGATLVLPEEGEEKDALRWNELVARHGVTLWCSVPAILEMLLACRDGNGLQSLRLLAQGGDYIKPGVIAQLRQLLPMARLISLGGPTETTIWSIWHEITAADQGAIPYGKPLPGNRYLVLDTQGQHCPVGVVGRIHTSGVNLALGYLKDCTLVQSDFVTAIDDREQSVRAFRTGDCARYRPDGTLMFVRRVNGYVKIGGVRVSLPDIEMALIGHPAVQHVMVVDYGDPQQGDTRIGALYVCRESGQLSASQLRDYARDQLAQSHVPTRFIAVPALPLTQNGKPDRAQARSRLTAPIARVSDADLPIASRTDGKPRAGAATPAGYRTRILDIYLDVLGSPQGARPTDDVDFIRLGLRPQHLKAISAQVRDVFSVDLTPAQLLRWRNAAEVETYLQQRLGNQNG